MSQPIPQIYDGQTFEDVASTLNALIGRVNAIYDAVMSAMTGEGTLSAAQLAELPTLNGVPLSGILTPAAVGLQPVTSYAQLDGKPVINGVTLAGNKTLADLGIHTDSDVEDIAQGVCIPSNPSKVPSLPDGKTNISIIGFSGDSNTPVKLSREVLRAILQEE